MRSGSCFARKTSARRTDARGSSSWPTPVASPGANRTTKPRPSETDGRGHGATLSAAAQPWPTPTASTGKRGDDVRGKNAEGGPTLTEAARAWPTPTTGGTGYKSGNNRDVWRPGLALAAKGARPVRLWPTATCGDAKRSGSRTLPGSKAHPGTSLTDATVRAWPTPTATRYGSTNNGSPHDGRDAYATAGTPSLETLAKQEGGILNPAFVCLLMGLPPDWTRQPGTQLTLPGLG